MWEIIVVNGSIWLKCKSELEPLTSWRLCSIIVERNRCCSSLLQSLPVWYRAAQYYIYCNIRECNDDVINLPMGPIELNNCKLPKDISHCCFETSARNEILNLHQFCLTKIFRHYYGSVILQCSLLYRNSLTLCIFMKSIRQ